MLHKASAERCLAPSPYLDLPLTSVFPDRRHEFSPCDQFVTTRFIGVLNKDLARPKSLRKLKSAMVGDTGLEPVTPAM